MPFIDVGAFGKDGKRIQTEEQLREELATDPAAVYFDFTAIFENVSGYKGDEIPPKTILSVVLPDPYKNRRVYVTVRLNADGSIVVA